MSELDVWILKCQIMGRTAYDMLLILVEHLARLIIRKNLLIE